MQYIETTKPKPYKVIPIYIPIEFEHLPNGDIKVIETQKNEIYLTKSEGIKVIKSIGDKIKNLMNSQTAWCGQPVNTSGNPLRTLLDMEFAPCREMKSIIRSNKQWSNFYNV